MDRDSLDRTAVMTECKKVSLRGKIPFPEVVRRLKEAGVERYHVDLSRDETTYYLPGGESHVLAMSGTHEPIVDGFDAAVRGAQRGEIICPEFLRRTRAAECVGYFTQIAGRRVQYVGRTGDMHVEPFPPAEA